MSGRRKATLWQSLYFFGVGVHATRRIDDDTFFGLFGLPVYFASGLCGLCCKVVYLAVVLQHLANIAPFNYAFASIAGSVAC